MRAPTSAELTRPTQILAQRIGRYLERQGLSERAYAHSPALSARGRLEYEC